MDSSGPCSGSVFCLSSAPAVAYQGPSLPLELSGPSVSQAWLKVKFGVFGRMGSLPAIRSFLPSPISSVAPPTTSGAHLPHPGLAPGYSRFFSTTVRFGCPLPRACCRGHHLCPPPPLAFTCQPCAWHDKDLPRNTFSPCWSDWGDGKQTSVPPLI